MTQPFDPKDVFQNIDMRGTLAVCSLGQLGLITSHTKIPVQYEDGKSAHAYVGVKLTGKMWSSRAPRHSAGTVKEWKESGMSLMLWLSQHGALCSALPEDADEKLEKLATDVGLL